MNYQQKHKLGELTCKPTKDMIEKYKPLVKKLKAQKKKDYATAQKALIGYKQSDYAMY
ncbi:hypothetical protein [Vibrio gallicus]|uniref:hypothetical protein n=1 Tax=Vibrio gallicus TaxID=190897 RepID=UPI0021C296F6|nr:hypothetical protein [Vibrio gallicus]